MPDFAFQGPALLTFTPYTGAPQETRKLTVTIQAAHPDSPGEYALYLPNHTGCIFTPGVAKALLGGRTAWIRIDRAYQCTLAGVGAQKSTQAAEEAPDAVL